jgi:hypothetical protein
MKKFLYVVSIFVLISCSNNEANQKEQVAPEIALPSSGAGDNNVFKATGEVVVIFEPSPARAAEFKKSSTPEFLKYQKEFSQTSLEFIKRLEAMGIKAYTSQEDFIKIMITDKQSYVVHTPGYDKGYGVALAKLNVQPKVINGLPSWEELEKEVKAYYGK